MKKIFIVFGTRGEYDDRIDYPVLSFSDEIEAIEYETQLIDWCKENKVHMDQEDRSSERSLKCPFDSQFVNSYTGTDYYRLEIPYID
jgi:hypothetical protein